MKSKLFLIFILSTILIIGCTSKIDTDRQPDFQSRYLPTVGESEGKHVWLALVIDKMAQNDYEMFNFPEEWEVYRIKLLENTKFLNESGIEISKEQFEMHDYEFKVWTKETFKKKRSKMIIEKDSSELKIDHLPMYSAVQIQLVQMTDEEYLARDYAKEKGEYTFQVYMGEAFGDQSKSSTIQEEIWEHIDLQDSKITKVEFASKPSERKERLLGINQYPIFILYDHEELLLKTTNLEEIMDFILLEIE